jgi:hypothetical protein
MVVPVRYRDPARFPQSVFHVVGLFEHFWSRADHEYCISRLCALGMAASLGSHRFIMNTESIFYPSANNMSEQIRECRCELELMLKTPSVEALADGPEPTEATMELVELLVGTLTAQPIETVVRHKD